MKKNLISAAIALVTSVMTTHAQEYLNVNSKFGESQIYLLEEIDHISVRKAPQVPDQMKSDENIKIFNAALEATGLNGTLGAHIDRSYDASKYSEFVYNSANGAVTAIVPFVKMKGYTLFVETDDVLKKYGVNNLQDLQALAKKIYDETYPEDAGLYDTELTNPKNPLYRFVAYHIVTTDIHSYDRLTGRKVTLNEEIQNSEFTIRTDRMNPIEWYRTLLPNTLVKCERLTMSNWMGDNSNLNNYYLNRRWDNDYQLRGAEVAQLDSTSSSVFNGRYFYVDNLVAFTTDVRDKVQNMLIRMDFSAVFPELTTLDIRQNGNDQIGDGSDYWFPNGSVDGLKVNSGTMIYRCPSGWRVTSQGDICGMYDDCDIEINLPPVPFSGEWQVRLGFCSEETNAIAQVYFDGVEQGNPIDFSQSLYELDVNINSKYSSMTYEEKVAEQKQLKEKGFYRGPYGLYSTVGQNEFIDRTYNCRRVLCQVYMDNTKEHTLRIKRVGENMAVYSILNLDYIELVPKNVYNVPEGQLEYDL